MLDAAAPILEDVTREHLDEGSYALVSRDTALHSPSYTLDELARGPEEQLLAHVHGLALGGVAARVLILEPELATPEEPSVARATVACLALLGQGRQDLVGNALWSAVAETASGAQRAFVLGAGAPFDAWLAQQLATDLEPAPRRVLLAIAAERGLPLPNLLLSLQSDDARELALAAKAGRRAPAARHLPALEALVDHDDQAVRDEATTSALVHGSLYAFQRCLSRAHDPVRSEAEAMLLVALLGAPSHHEVLVAQLERPTHAQDALFALGFTGNASVLPHLIAWMRNEDPMAARLASEAYMTITGLDTTQEPYGIDARDEADGLPALEDDDLDADLVPPPALELPLPDPGAIETFHALHGISLDGRSRRLFGHPWTVASALHFLDHVSLRRRHALASWLEIRTGGAIRIDTKALVSVQKVQREAARPYQDAPYARTYG